MSVPADSIQDPQYFNDVEDVPYSLHDTPVGSVAAMGGDLKAEQGGVEIPMQPIAKQPSSEAEEDVFTDPTTGRNVRDITPAEEVVTSSSTEPLAKKRTLTEWVSLRDMTRFINGLMFPSKGWSLCGLSP